MADETIPQAQNPVEAQTGNAQAGTAFPPQFFECVNEYLELTHKQSQKYGDHRYPQFHAGDRDIAVQVDSISFAIPVRREDGLLVARSQAV